METGTETELNKIRHLILSEDAFEDALDRSIKKNPNKLADAISPIIGPSIRLSIKDYIERMLFAFNQAVEEAFSMKGLALRWESRKTGLPLSEVILLHNLLYRVEDIFVVHAQTGILLLHCSSRHQSNKSADRTAGMLTAIHVFAGETFPGTKQQGLRSIKVGEVDLWVEEYSGLLIAAAIRGQAPNELKYELLGRLKVFRETYENDLRQFAGNVAPFQKAADMFKECLIQQTQRPDQDVKLQKKKVSKLPALIVLFILLGLGIWFSTRALMGYRNRQLVQDYISTIDHTRGVVLLNSEEDDGVWTIRVLKSSQLKITLPGPPPEITDKIKLIERPFTMEATYLNPLDQIRLPYYSDTKVLNGNPGDQIALFARLIKEKVQQGENDFKVHAFVYDDPEDDRTKLLLSHVIGQLENSLSQAGIRNNKIIHYSIYNGENFNGAPQIFFEVIYD